ncbi:hypothetical protein CDAR_172291 [Caerostris darwini]|uniref:Uncharacterized protein n=1 Tax=Caerostris darwini TaxID=1538125 RepID=A0AAV4MFE8_9ARAC|nr:hypothetical protein CDAR_172291 [Caerostris darwini]
MFHSTKLSTDKCKCHGVETLRKRKVPAFIERETSKTKYLFDNKITSHSIWRYHSGSKDIRHSSNVLHASVYGHSRNEYSKWQNTMRSSRRSTKNHTSSAGASREEGIA